MSRNITIVVVILILVVAVGYLIWLRNQYQPPASPAMQQQAVDESISPSPTISASPVASSSASPTPTSTP